MQNTINLIFHGETRKEKNRRWIIMVILFCILMTIAIVIVPWKKTWQILENSNLILIGLAILLTLPTQLLAAISYYLIARKQNALLGFWRILLINMIMPFYEVVLPSTFFVSGMRWFRYSQHSRNPAQTLTSIAYLKAFNILVTLLMSIGLLVFLNETTLEGFAVQITLLIAGIALILFFTPAISKSLVKILPKYGNQEGNILTKGLLYKYFIKVLTAFANFQNLGFKTLLALIIIGLATQWLHYYAYTLFAKGVGIELSLAQLGTIRAILLIVANLPINFSVGIGLREFSLVGLLVAMKIPLDQATAMSVVVLAKNYFFGVIGGAIEAVNLVKKKFLGTNSITEQTE
jgi:uncharacterized membrane protein YbhN (UPF0104 family)